MSTPVGSRPSSWKAALVALLTPKRSDTPAVEPSTEAPGQVEDDREPFHLDDLSLAKRLRRDRGLVQYRTPPHARLVFPTLTGQ
ncbi:MAG: hypothetical protein ABIY52_10890 [Gemmatimonadaceae bacterium]